MRNLNAYNAAIYQCIKLHTFLFQIPSPSKIILTDKSAVNSVETLADLSTVHAVGLAPNPTNPDVVLYADETAIYELDKNTGKLLVFSFGVNT